MEQIIVIMPRKRIPGYSLGPFQGEDTVHFPLEEGRVISFQSQHATGRMQYLFELLFRVLEGNYTLGNFIYISQVLSLILAETYNREKKDSVPEQNRHVTRWSAICTPPPG